MLGLVMPISVSMARTLEELDPKVRQAFYEVFEEVDRQIGETVTKKEFNELKGIVAELAKAQNELVEAQKRTEEELRKLVADHRRTREQLGGLTHTVVYVLEDRAFKGLPSLLERDGIEVIESLKRDYVEVGRNRYVEVNIIGRGRVDGRDVVIVGEGKAQLKKGDVDRFVKVVDRLRGYFEEEVIPVMVTYQASPQVRRYVEEKGIRLYFSYEFPL